MKKFLMLIVAVLLIFNTLTVCAIQDDVININLEFNAKENTIMVSGIVKNNRDRIPMTLRIEKDGNVIALSETTAIGNTEGGIPFAFDVAPFSPVLKSGTCTLTITAAFTNVSETATYEYTGVDKYFDALLSLNDLSEKTDYVIDDVYVACGILGAELKDLQTLTAESNKTAVRSLMKRKYTIPDDVLSEENCYLVRQAVSDFYDNYNEAVQLGRFFDIKTSSELKQWYDENKNTYGFLVDDNSTSVDEEKMLPYFDSAISSEGLLDRRKYMSSVNTMAELNSLMKEQAVLQTVVDSGRYIVRNVLTDFPSLLSVDYDSWNSLNSSEQDEVCLIVAGKTYENFQGLSKAVEDAINTVSDTQTEQSGNKGSGGGGGGSFGISSSIVEQSIPTLVSFIDLAEVPWAFQSIKYLHSKGIISGRSDQIYDPMSSITRAELAKMIVVALDMKPSGNSVKFLDVPQDAWYAQYVSVAAEHGVILGDQSGKFHPEAAVSRQDAVVMIYRALQITDIAEKAAFADYLDISDYAKKAVDYMFYKGVINGVGDGKFAPKMSLSRAEIAKMLHFALIL